MKLSKFTGVLVLLLFCRLPGSVQAQGMKIFGAAVYGMGTTGDQ